MLASLREKSDSGGRVQEPTPSPSRRGSRGLASHAAHCRVAARWPAGRPPESAERPGSPMRETEPPALRVRRHSRGATAPECRRPAARKPSARRAGTSMPDGGLHTAGSTACDASRRAASPVQSRRRPLPAWVRSAPSFTSPSRASGSAPCRRPSCAGSRRRSPRGARRRCAHPRRGAWRLQGACPRRSCALADRRRRRRRDRSTQRARARG